jgi:hypothetical protein
MQQYVNSLQYVYLCVRALAGLKGGNGGLHEGLKG